MALTLCLNVNSGPYRRPQGGFSHSRMSRAAKGAPPPVHNIAIWGGGGYGGLMHSYNYSQFKGNIGGSIGIGYECIDRHLLVHVGPEFRFLSNNDIINVNNLPDADNYKVTKIFDNYTQIYQYRFTQPLTEKHKTYQLMLPIEVGMIWNKWYFLGGIKLGYTFIGDYVQKGYITTSIHDLTAHEQWDDIDILGANTNQAYNKSGRNKYGIDAAIAAEIGLNLEGFSTKWMSHNEETSHPIHFRLSLFAEYGVKNLGLGVKDNKIVTFNQNGISTESLHNSDLASGNNTLNSFLVGIRFTAAIQLNKPVQNNTLKPSLTILAYDKATHKPVIGAQVNITSKKTNRTTNKFTNQKGIVNVRIDAGEYSIEAQADGYANSEEQIIRHLHDKDTALIGLQQETMFEYQKEVQEIQTTDKDETINEHTVISGQSLTWINFYFATNESDILPESKKGLEDLYNILTANPSIRIQIIGHTDNIGSSANNLRLSAKRAENVKAEMVKRGITPERIETIGKGESAPIKEDSTEVGRAQNRCVELIVL